ncbi:hypothetical protein [Spiroplasma endosymbiont of Villa modesta]
MSNEIITPAKNIGLSETGISLINSFTSLAVFFNLIKLSSLLTFEK